MEPAVPVLNAGMNEASHQSQSLEQNHSLYLIDTNSVIYCRFCEKVVVFHANFESKHRLFVIDTNEDLANFLDQAVTAFPSSVSHPHYRSLREASSYRISGPLRFKEDFGTLLEGFSHLATDISLSECEPSICNLTHIKFNKRPWSHLTLNLDNCHTCEYSKENSIFGDIQDFSPSFIPSWRPTEAAKEPPCASVFRLQNDLPWRKDFHRTCHHCKRRRLLRSSYTLGIRKLWQELYSIPFCTCPFHCFGGF